MVAGATLALESKSDWRRVPGHWKSPGPFLLLVLLPVIVSLGGFRISTDENEQEHEHDEEKPGLPQDVPSVSPQDDRQGIDEIGALGEEEGPYSAGGDVPAADSEGGEAGEIGWR